MIYLAQPISVPFSVLTTAGADYTDATPPAVLVVQSDLTHAAATNAATRVSGGLWAVALIAGEIASALVTIAWSGSGIVSNSKTLSVETEIDSLDGVDRLNQLPGEGPLTVIPDAPADSSLCRVYGYAVRLNATVAPNVPIRFDLLPSTAVKTDAGALVSQRQVSVLSDETGLIQADLLRGFTYKIVGTNQGLLLDGKTFEATGETFDLASLV